MENTSSKRTALLIGGSSGIGLATLIKLSSRDFDIVLIHRDRRQQIEELTKTIDAIHQGSDSRVFSYNMDAINEEKIIGTINQIKKEFSHIDLVLHAVARGNLKPMFSPDAPKLSKQDFDLTIDAMGINLHTWVNLLLERDLIGEDSRIVALTSEGNDRVLPNYGAVASAKSVLETIVKYLAVELAPYGVTINAVQPGVTDTASLRLIPGSEKLISESIRRNPFHRLTTPEDVANVVYLLSQPEARWINGALIHVDGGEHLV